MLFDRIAKFFRRNRAVELAEFKAMFQQFQQILTGNNRILELISDLEDKLSYYEGATIPSITLELLRDEVQRMLWLPAAIVRGLYGFGKHADSIRGEIFKRTSALVELFGYAIRKAPVTPLNGPLGPHRTFDWLDMSLDDVKAVRRHFGCTVNDLVLATVTGAVRSYLIRRRVDPNEIDFRVSAPVSVRRDEDKGKLGNHVSSWIVRLPVQEKDAVRRLESIHRVTDELKRSEQALGVQMLMAAGADERRVGEGCRSAWATSP